MPMTFKCIGCGAEADVTQTLTQRWEWIPLEDGLEHPVCQRCVEAAEKGEPMAPKNRTPQGYQIIGYWSKTKESSVEEGLPWPGSLVNPEMSVETRTLVGDYLDGLYEPVKFYMAYRGGSNCRLCGKNNGSYEYHDGMYAWPEGLAHYVRKHGVRLPPEFIRRIGVVRGKPQPKPSY